MAKKSILLCLLMSIAFLWPISNFFVKDAEAYESGPGKTHEWIFKQAKTILENDGYPYEFWADFLDSADPGNPGHTYLDTLIEGGDDVDEPLIRAKDHYMDPTDHYGLFDDVTQTLFKSAGKVCQQNFTDAVSAWNAGNKHDAIYKLGWAAHIVQDLCVPHHAFPTAVYGHSDYESWVNTNKASYAVNSGGIYSFSSFPDYEYYVADNSEYPQHYVWDSAFAWVDFNAHESIKHFARANNQTGPVADGYTVETMHDIPNDLATWWNITVYGASSMQLLFTEINMQLNDYVHIYNASDQLQASYTGHSFGVLTPNVTGNTLKIKIETDSTTQSWGYEADLLTFWDGGQDFDAATDVLLKRAQKTTAGFIHFFFQKVHAPPAPVGGVWVPVDRLGLLTPYIVLTSTIVVATVATAVYVKRVKRRKKRR